MTRVSIDLRDVSGYSPAQGDVVQFEAPYVRGSAKNPGGVVSTAPVNVRLTNGKGEVDLEPGVVKVTIKARSFRGQRQFDGVVPDGQKFPEVTLLRIIENEFDYPPAVVSEVTKLTIRTETARQEAQDSAEAASRSQKAAKQAETQAEAHRQAAENAQKASQAAQSASEQAQETTEQARSEATSARDLVVSSVAQAKESQEAAKRSEDSARESASSASDSAREAGESKDAAASSAQEAQRSQEAAKESETNAGLSQEAASESAAAALESQRAAKQSEDKATSRAEELSVRADALQQAQTEAASSAEQARNHADRAERVVGETRWEGDRLVVNGVRSESLRGPKGEGVGNPEWENIINRPATFEPSPHRHDSSEIDGLDEKADLVGGKVPTRQLPGIALTKPTPVNDRSGMLGLDAEEGDVAVITQGKDKGSYMLGSGDSKTFESWVKLSTPESPVTSVNGQTGVINLSAKDVGAITEDDISGKVDGVADYEKNGDTIAKRWNDGTLQVGDPKSGYHAATKKYVDDCLGGLKIVKGAPPGKPDPNTLYVEV